MEEKLGEKVSVTVRESNAANEVKVGATRREYATTIGNGILLDRERDRNLVRAKCLTVCVRSFAIDSKPMTEGSLSDKLLCWVQMCG